MGTPQTTLALLFGLALIGGFLWGLFYDACPFSGTWRAFAPDVPLRKGGTPSGEMPGRRQCRVGAILSRTAVFLHDLLFSLGAAVFLILLLYDVNRGIFRSFVFVCMAAGYGIYRVSLRRVLLPLMGRVRAVFYLVTERVIRPPFRFLSHAAGKYIFHPIRTACARVLRRIVAITHRTTGNPPGRDAQPEIKKSVKKGGTGDENSYFSKEKRIGRSDDAGAGTGCYRRIRRA